MVAVGAAERSPAPGPARRLRPRAPWRQVQGAGRLARRRTQPRTPPSDLAASLQLVRVVEALVTQVLLACLALVLLLVLRRPLAWLGDGAGEGLALVLIDVPALALRSGAAVIARTVWSVRRPRPMAANLDGVPADMPELTACSPPISVLAWDFPIPLTAAPRRAPDLRPAQGAAADRGRGQIRRPPGGPGRDPGPALIVSRRPRGTVAAARPLPGCRRGRCRRAPPGPALRRAGGVRRGRRGEVCPDFGCRRPDCRLRHSA